jgi:hypothetical protein
MLKFLRLDERINEIHEQESCDDRSDDHDMIPYEVNFLMLMSSTGATKEIHGMLKRSTDP